MFTTMRQCAEHKNHNCDLPTLGSYGPLNIVNSDLGHKIMLVPVIWKLFEIISGNIIEMFTTITQLAEP